MIITYTRTADRSHTGGDFKAYFHKRKSNTIMMEDMWFEAVQHINYFDELYDKLKEMSKGYSKVKATVSVYKPDEDVILCSTNSNGQVSINIERVR